ncbi:unnamed protein product [Protopolystoma xenopodis]|uniref:Protein SCAI n=1 Tax=Protopolystoma xenopodis TaxID=117903 RepID=A0A3S5CK69_9PLAT|nr:unnamed protein product [Protopolystoma xenopodis]
MPARWLRLFGDLTLMAFEPPVDLHERTVVSDFCHLLEKSKQLFNGLRDLPQYGHKQWQAYFSRTFDVYTKLWKYQQTHRQILDEVYGLKRWQIGEIASKIGQLYYHYYLRTSETYYLNESFSFFDAIRNRDYYSRATKEDRPDLMVKKLRYYARFIVVCLLLKKMKHARDLVREFAKQIDDYTAVYDPEDHLEWTMVVQEIRDFIEADSICPVLDSDNMPIVVTHRMNMGSCPSIEKAMSSDLHLSEIIIVGNCYEQTRFSELTLDMFRMLQTLERDPQDSVVSALNNLPGAAKQDNANVLENGGAKCVIGTPLDHPLSNIIQDGSPVKLNNPHKYLLYKPTFSLFNSYLASGFKDLPVNGALLLYISADGIPMSTKQLDDRKQ